MEFTGTKKTGDARKEWVGYKVQVAETVPEGPLEPGEPTPALITAIVTQSATGSDEADGRDARASRPRWEWTNRRNFTWTAPTSRASFAAESKIN